MGTTATGLWLRVGEAELFLPFAQFPWFASARVRDIYKVEILHGHHLHWPELDVDLDVDAVAHPEDYPLVYE